MQERDVYAELSSIRSLMERSSKFISLSGLSGILAGIYALIGARFGLRAMENITGVHADQPYVKDAVVFLVLVGLGVLILSTATAYWLTLRKAKKRNENIWNPVSRRMMEAVSYPFITGGLVMLVLLMQEAYTAIAPASLIFYGLALVAGSEYTFKELKWLGIAEILIGVIALNNPASGLILWAVGFGVLHILYGTFMYYKYER